VNRPTTHENSFSHTEVIRPELPTIEVNSLNFGQNYGSGFSRVDNPQEFYSGGYNRSNLPATSEQMMKSEPDSEGNNYFII